MEFLNQIPLGANEAWLVPGLPLASFVLLVIGFHRIRWFAPIVSILAVGFAFVVALGALGDYLAEGTSQQTWTWLRSANAEFSIGYTVDALSTMMIVLATSVSLGVQVYSLEYMKGEPRLGWYFAAHSLFVAAMLGLVLTQSLLIMYLSWELVGLCSFLLIGFWYERRPAAEAAKKAFITTRLGDVGLLIGILILFVEAGRTFEIEEVFLQLDSFSQGFLALAAFLVFLGAAGKSAQIPFHVWLPDAMEGPTPVSALIHAATMVAAGVFLVARLFPLFLAAPGVLWLIAIVGLLTAVLAGLMALSETDFKRILAHSTVSQLGFMMMALGAAGLAGEEHAVGGMFHLVTHGYFKALLFLTAGVTLHAIHQSSASIYEVRGLGRKAPFTAAALVVGSLALAGLPPLSGFFSKEGVLAAPLELGGIGGMALLIGTLGASFLSALYMARLAMVVVSGRAEGKAEHLHDPPFAMFAPLAILTLLAVGVGAALVFVWDIGPFLGGGEFHFDPALGTASTVTAVAGLVVGWALYRRNVSAPDGLVRVFGPIPRWSARRFYFDDTYTWITRNVVFAFAELVRVFDRVVMNDIGVDRSGMLAVWAGRLLRPLQTGFVYNYALAIALGTAVLGAVALVGR